MILSIWFNSKCQVKPHRIQLQSKNTKCKTYEKYNLDMHMPKVSLFPPIFSFLDKMQKSKRLNNKWILIHGRNLSALYSILKSHFPNKLKIRIFFEDGFSIYNMSLGTYDSCEMWYQIHGPFGATKLLPDRVHKRNGSIRSIYVGKWKQWCRHMDHLKPT
jgi:hypothetical protein